MAKSRAFGWLPCSHVWTDVTATSDLARGVRVSMCMSCDETKEEAMGEIEEEEPTGWRSVITEIDTIEGYVRLSVFEEGSGHILYAARYTPETARTMAEQLTLKSFRAEGSME